jgi:L-amino acid N-acyltransferase YncA
VTPNLSIRDVVPDDAEGVCRVINPIIEAGTYTVFDAPFDVESERDYIQKFPARGVWKVALEAETNQVVGWQVLEPLASYTAAFDHVASIGTYVELTRRRRGIASALFAASFDAARSKGFEKLFTFVRADNAAALSTYQAHGFTVVGTSRRHARLHGRYIDELVIERML